MFFRFFYNFLFPERGLYLSDMRFSQEKHTNPGLSDAASDGKGKFPQQNGFLEGQFGPFLASCFFKLF